MKIYSYKMSDDSKIYDFFMTNAARKEIDEKNRKKLEKLGNSDLLLLFNKTQRMRMELSKEQDEDKKQLIQEKLDEATVELLPHITELQDFDQVDVEEIPLILLRNHKDNKDINVGEYEYLLEDMETTLGFEKYNEVLDEICEKVFTLIEKVNDHRNKALKKAKTVEEPKSNELDFLDKEYDSFEQLCYESLIPTALESGMTLDQFWYEDCELMYCFIEAYYARLHRQGWINGIYTQRAFEVALAEIIPTGISIGLGLLKDKSVLKEFNSIRYYDKSIPDMEIKEKNKLIEKELTEEECAQLDRYQRAHFI